MPVRRPGRVPRIRLSSRTRRTVAVAGALTATMAVAAPALAVLSGPDVASYQHGTSINWSAVKSAGKTFVFVKATEGTSYTNPYFAGDWAGTRAVGLIHGAYHFARPSIGSAKAQADRFISIAGLAHDPGDLPPTLDLEATGGLSTSRLVTWTHNFLAEVTARTGRTPIIYSYPYFWKTSMGNSAAFTQYPLWVASYGVSSPPTIVWPTWTFWQYSSTSTVSGISGQVDMDSFNGSLAQLQKLANITTVTSPPATVPPTATPTSPTVSTSTTPPPVSASPTPPSPKTPKITTALNHTTIYLGRSARLYGHVSPFRSGQLLYRQGYYDGAWHTWATGRVRSDGTYNFTIKPTVRAVNTYRVKAPATTGLTSAVSRTVRLTVR